MVRSFTVDRLRAQPDAGVRAVRPYMAALVGDSRLRGHAGHSYRPASMSLSDLAGASFGPFLYRTSVEKVMEYIAATGDDPDRWTVAAPPSLAGALLFEVAPHLLAQPSVEGASVVHGDQQFTWHRAIPLEADLGVTGTVSRARERGGVWFVVFDMEVSGSDGPVLSGTSTFLMSGPDATVVEPAESEEEPPPEAGSVTEDLRRAASRADLVRYAGASRDWNPIHWDHDAAVAAGLSGVVVHGLLQSAWLTIATAGLASGSHPFVGGKFRYRAPLRPAVEALISTDDRGGGRIDAALQAGDTVHVTGVFQRNE